MTDKTGNHKIHPPKLAITRNMIIEGKIKLDQLTAEDDDEVCESDIAQFLGPDEDARI